MCDTKSFDSHDSGLDEFMSGIFRNMLEATNINEVSVFAANTAMRWCPRTDLPNGTNADSH